MDLKILQKKEEPLLSRIKVESEIAFEKSTPSEQEVKAKLAQNLGKDEKLIDVKTIHTLYGVKKAKILCYAYENEEILKRVKVEGKKAKEKSQKAGKKEEVKDQEAKKEESHANQEQDAKERKQEEKKESKEEKQE